MKIKPTNNFKILSIAILIIFFIALFLAIFVYLKQSNKISDLHKQVQDEKIKKTTLQRKIAELESKVEALQKALKEITPSKSDKARKFLQEKAQKEEIGEIKLSPSEVIRAFGYIKRIYQKGNKNYLEIDYAEFYRGEEAKSEYKKDGSPQRKIGELESGYYIRNRNSKLRTFEIGDEVEIYLCSFRVKRGGIDLTLTDISKLKDILNNPSHKPPIPVWIDLKDNKVVKIVEQYLP